MTPPFVLFFFFLLFSPLARFLASSLRWFREEISIVWGASYGGVQDQSQRSYPPPYEPPKSVLSVEAVATSINDRFDGFGWDALHSFLLEDQLQKQKRKSKSDNDSQGPSKSKSGAHSTPLHNKASRVGDPTPLFYKDTQIGVHSTPLQSKSRNSKADLSKVGVLWCNVAQRSVVQSEAAQSRLDSIKMRFCDGCETKFLGELVQTNCMSQIVSSPISFLLVYC